MAHYEYVIDKDAISPDGKSTWYDWFYRYKYQTEGHTWVPVRIGEGGVAAVFGSDPGQDVLWFTVREGEVAHVVWKVFITGYITDPIWERMEVWFKGDAPPLKAMIRRPPGNTVQFRLLEEEDVAGLLSVTG